MIREATASDLPALLAIQGAALDEPWPALLRASIDGPPLVLVQDPPGMEGEGPIGYALVIRADEAAYVPELAVAPPAQGEGHGSRLLEALLDRLEDEGARRVRLTARAEDQGLHSFYADHGFELRERIPDHYEDGDGVLLEVEFGEGD